MCMAFALLKACVFVNQDTQEMIALHVRLNNLDDKTGNDEQTETDKLRTDE